MKQVIYFDQDNIAGCCGVDVLYHFGTPALLRRQRPILKSGTGYYVATFIDRPHQHAAYEYLCRERQLVFQTEPRRNGGGINKVFVAIFGPKVKVKKDKTVPATYEANWPQAVERRGEKFPKL